MKSRIFHHDAVDSKIEISDWFFEAPEEILAFIKECRYTEATELILKLKEEVARILHEVGILLLVYKRRFPQ